MNERDRSGRNRDQGGFGQQQRRPWDRQRYQAESTGYPDEDRDRGYSRLGGAGEEDYERYRSGAEQSSYQTPQSSYQTPREYDREYGGRESRRGYGHEPGYHGPERGYGQAPSGQHGSGQYGQSGQRERGRFAGRGPKGYKRSDERIREDLCDALMMDPEIDASEIEVEVSDGEVTISGSVQEREDKWRAEQLADAIPGVRDVNNTIRARRGGSGQSASSTSDSDNARNAARGSASSSGSNVSQGGLGNGTRS